MSHLYSPFFVSGFLTASREVDDFEDSDIEMPSAEVFYRRGSLPDTSSTSNKSDDASAYVYW